MVFVLCKRRWGASVSKGAFHNLIQDLPKAIVKNLGIPPETRINTFGIPIWIFDGNPHEHDAPDIEIVLFCEHSRHWEYLDTRRERLQEDIKKLLPDGITFLLIVLLAPMSWGERTF